MNGRDKPIAVFFTNGVSLELWDARGMLSREIRFYEALAEKTGEVWFFTYGKNDLSYQDRVGNQIKIFPKRFPIPNILYGMILPFIFYRQLKQVRLIRIQQMAGTIPALIAHWFLQKPLLVRCGYQWSGFLQKEKALQLKQLVVFLIELVTYQSARAVIVATNEDAQYIIRRYALSIKKISVIPNYVDTNLFKPIDIEKEKNSICFVGRLEPQKNLFNLVDAVRGLNIHLIFYGGGSMKDELEQKAKSLGVHLSLWGKIPNEQLPKVLNTCEIFILPSWYEGNPKVLLEAMACGIPMIGTRVEGIESIIEHNQNGILCETNPESIHDAILDLLNDPEKQLRLGKAARETILASASLSQTIDTECKILNAIGL